MLASAALLTWLLLLPVLGALCILALPPAQAARSRPLAMIFLLLTALMAVLAARQLDWSRAAYGAPDAAPQLAFRFTWIPAIGAAYHVGVDGLSLTLILVAIAVTLLACWAWREPGKSPRAAFALLLLLLAATIGVFIALDLLLFCFFFALCALPASFLIANHPAPMGARTDDQHAGIKLLLFNILGSIALLLAMIFIYLATRGLGPAGAGVLDLIHLASDPIVRMRLAHGGSAGSLAPAGFALLLVAFAVRLPLFPLHLWLPDAHARAATPVSMVLTATLSAGGAYGLLRIAYAVLPTQAAEARFYVALIAVVTILYAALLALAQHDLKRLAAYAGISVTGYVVLGIAVMHSTALAGGAFQLVSCALGAALLFFAIGIIEDRAKRRDINGLGGMASVLPGFTGWAAVAFLTAIGMPGLYGFVGVLLVLLGTFAAAGMGATGPAAQHSTGIVWLGALAAVAILVNAGTFAWTFQRVFMGAARLEHQNFPRLTRLERAILAMLGLSCVILGIVPALLLDHLNPALEGLLRVMAPP